MLPPLKHTNLRAVTLVVVLTAAPLWAQSRPSFQAAKVLKPSVLRGLDYVIEDNVSVADSRYVFVLRTPYGPIQAKGLDMLWLRIGEMRAIREAERMVQDSPELSAVIDNLKKTGRGLQALVDDPGGAIKSIPHGIGHKAKELTSKESRSGEARRELAAGLGCDPETHNLVLNKLMGQVSMRRSAGQGLMTAATFGLTGGAALAAQGATALQTTADMQQMLGATPLYKLNENVEHNLIVMGADPTVAGQFAQHPEFTTLQRLQLVAQLRRLGGKPGLARLANVAMQARSEADALGVIRCTQLLADLSRDRPFAEILDADTPAARLADGRIVAIVSADYLESGPALWNWIAGINRLTAAGKAPAPPILLTTGWISPGVKNELKTAKIEFIEGSRIDRVK